jgi:ATP-binding cassette subfamily B protein
VKVFRRLLGFLSPYRSGVIASLLLAAVAMGATVLIPFIVGRTVDDIRAGGGSLWPLALALVGAGLVRRDLKQIFDFRRDRVEHLIASGP